MLVHIQEAIKQTNYCKQTILRLINTGAVQGYFNGNNSIVNIEQLKARKTSVKRGKKSYTYEQEQEVIKLFTTTKDNHTTTISRKTGVNIHSVNKILDKYIYETLKNKSR